MLRVTQVLRRQGALAREQFDARFRELCGAWVAEHAGALDLRRCVLVHTADEPLSELLRASRGAGEPYDGVLELGWEDRTALVRVLESAQGLYALAHLRELLSRFVDLSLSPVWPGQEHAVVEGPGRLAATPRSELLRLFFVGPCLPAWKLDEAQRYWREQHAALALRHAAAVGVLRYVQVHRIEDPRELELRQALAAAEPSPLCLGHTEIWWTRQQLQQSLASPQGQQAMGELLEDERRFADLPRCALWLATETVLLEA